MRTRAILRLARVPNLLTMMALIHRIETTLPHGRALLYDRIAEAYLESIDKFRGLYSGAHDLPQKKFWLARVGYEMQRRRALAEETDGEASAFRGKAESPYSLEILVESGDVVAWLAAEMERGRTAVGVDSPEEFLDFVGRRSGLFLPRAEGRYAFIHLSFQEYFAAVALERDVTGIDWARGKRSPLGFFREDLAKWAEQSVWRETFVFSLRAACPQERLARRSAGLRIRRGFFAIEEYAGARRTDTESGFPCRETGDQPTFGACSCEDTGCNR